MTHPLCLPLLALLLASAGPAWAQPAPAEPAPGSALSAVPHAGRPVRDVLRLQRLDRQVRGAARRLERLGGPEVTEAFSRTVRLPRNGTFDLQNFAGDITLTGSGGDDVRIEAVKRVRGRAGSDPQALLAEMTIAVVERGDRVEVRPASPRRRGWPGAVDFAITVPAGAHVSIRSASGRVHVTHVNGDLQIQTVSGDIVAADVRRLQRVRTVSGGIDLRRAQGLEVSGGTVSGLVSIGGLDARGLDLQSVSGDLRVTGASVERVFVRSVNGDIEFTGALSSAGRYELRTHGGDIRVTPSGGFTLDAATVTGDVRSDVALTVDRLGPPPPGRGAGQARRLIGKAGGGGAVVDIRSFSGDIVVTP